MTEQQKKQTRGRKRLGDQPMTATERGRRYRERLITLGVKPVQFYPSAKLRECCERFARDNGMTNPEAITCILATYFGITYELPPTFEGENSTIDTSKG